MTNYAPGSETDLSRAVMMRSEITRMLNLCTLPELEMIKENLMSSHTAQRPFQKSLEQIQEDWAKRNIPFAIRE